MTMLSATSHAPEHPGNPWGAPMPYLRLLREASADAGTPITDPAEVHEEVESLRAKYGAGSWRTPEVRCRLRGSARVMRSPRASAG